MKTCPRICLALALALAAAAPARAADTFNLDQQHFSIVFSVSHMNLSYTYGMFRQANARVVLDRENPPGTQFQMTIDTGSIFTNEEGRDRHLTGPEFFDAATYPAITFESTSVVPDPRADQPGINYQVTGNLTMHGVTRQITIPIRLLGEGPGPDGKMRAGFLATTELKRSEFGVGGGRFADPGVIGDAIAISVSFEAIKQDAPGASPPAR